jgi:hypothetical protein
MRLIGLAVILAVGLSHPPSTCPALGTLSL